MPSSSMCSVHILYDTDDDGMRTRCTCHPRLYIRSSRNYAIETRLGPVIFSSMCRRATRRNRNANQLFCAIFDCWPCKLLYDVLSRLLATLWPLTWKHGVWPRVRFADKRSNWAIQMIFSAFLGIVSSIKCFCNSTNCTISFWAKEQWIY